MKKRSILVLILTIFLVITLTVAGTYSVIIEVINNSGIDEVINEITITDLMTDSNNQYNETYYYVTRELDISQDEASILMDSEALNKQLQIAIKSIVKYKLHRDNSAILSQDEVYNMIYVGVMNTNNVSNELKNKVINKSKIYIDDVIEFIYDIDVSALENLE